MLLQIEPLFYVADILNGDISISNNNQLCLENTIRWDDILSGEGAQVHIQNSHTDYRRPCTCAPEPPGVCALGRAPSPHCIINCFRLAAVLSPLSLSVAVVTMFSSVFKAKATKLSRLHAAFYPF